jgi:hypothetical protein
MRMAWGWSQPRARALVDVACPGVPVSCAVGEDADVFAQALVAGPAEGGVAAEAITRSLDLVGVDRENEDAGREQTSVLLSDMNVVPVTGPVDPADCAHGSPSSVKACLQDADQEIPWRVLIGRPSVGRRPVAALGASHHRKGHVSCGPSQRQAPRALVRRWSAMCAGSQASPSRPSGENSLPRKENESNLTTEQQEVAL